MKRKKYYYLDPVIIRIPGIKTLFEKSVGKRDARQNQVCSNGEVHTTPFIDAKVNSYNEHIEKLLLKTTNELAPMIQEANSLLVEYSLMESHKGGELPEGCGEEEQRQKAAVAANYKAAAEAALKDATSVIASAGSKGIFHKNNAARKVSRLTKLVNGLA